MKTGLRVLRPEDFRAEELDEACEILRNGGLVAFPTETVYGLGGDALREEAAAEIYKAKGRPSDNPLIVHIADVEALEKLAKNVPPAAYRLAEAFWPGPLTMILEKRECIPYGTTGGLDTVAVRFPKHPVAQALIARSGVYLAAPSANTSGRPSPTRAEHVLEDLDGKIDYILDGGKVGIGLESTIIDLTGAVPVILRPGAITMDMLEEVLGKVEIDKAVLSQQEKSDMVAKAPGMKYRHYAPHGQMVIVEGTQEKTVRKIRELVKETLEEPGASALAVLASEETKDFYQDLGVLVCTLGSRTDKAAQAFALYDVLRQMDSLGVSHIFAESFDSDGLGYAVMNRMKKAAGYHIIDAEGDN